MARLEKPMKLRARRYNRFNGPVNFIRVFSSHLKFWDVNGSSLPELDDIHGSAWYLDSRIPVARTRVFGASRGRFATRGNSAYASSLSLGQSKTRQSAVSSATCPT